MGDEVKITVIATGFKQDEMPLRRDRMLAEPALPTNRHDVPIRHYSTPKPPAARFASETAVELDVKPAGSPSPEQVSIIAPAAPIEPQQAAHIATEELVPVPASVFDDDFFRSSQESETSDHAKDAFASASSRPAAKVETPGIDEHDFLLSTSPKQAAPKSTPSWEPSVAEPVVRNPVFVTAHTAEVEQRESDELDIPAFLRRSH